MPFVAVPRGFVSRHVRARLATGRGCHRCQSSGSCISLHLPEEGPGKVGLQHIVAIEGHSLDKGVLGRAVPTIEQGLAAGVIARLGTIIIGCGGCEQTSRR